MNENEQNLAEVISLELERDVRRYPENNREGE